VNPDPLTPLSNDSRTLSHKAESLARVTFFKRLEPDELEQLAARVEQVTFEPDATIFSENDKGDALYVVHSGTVRIWVLDEDAEPVTLAELKEGAFFGELAVLDRGPRSTNASAVDATVLHRLSSDDFQQFLLVHPEASIDVICEIGARMRQTNMLVTTRVTRNINAVMEEKATLGQRVADKVASFGGSWTFIIIYTSFLVFWMGLNSYVLVRYGANFDPFPYILLNLMLSMTAALQAPIIMMSQNRAAYKDRLAAEQDFKVNLKSELLLEELMRRTKARESQMQEILDGVNNLKRS
jgi:CRP/FNR family transcriptional regulator, cyclic AMP receptor protein